MTKTYYWQVLGKSYIEKDWHKFLDSEDNYKGATRKNVRTLLEHGFEDDTTAFTTVYPITGARSAYLSKEKQFTPEYNLPVSDVKNSQWLRASCQFSAEPKEWDWWRMTQFIVRFRKGDQIIGERMIRLQRLVEGVEDKTIWFDVKVPKTDFDRATVLFWNAESEKNIKLDNLMVEGFDGE